MRQQMSSWCDTSIGSGDYNAPCPRCDWPPRRHRAPPVNGSNCPPRQFSAVMVSRKAADRLNMPQNSRRGFFLGDIPNRPGLCLVSDSDGRVVVREIDGLTEVMA